MYLHVQQFWKLGCLSKMPLDGRALFRGPPFQGLIHTCLLESLYVLASFQKEAILFSIKCASETCRWRTAHYRCLDGCNVTLTSRSQCGHEWQQSLQSRHSELVLPLPSRTIEVMISHSLQSTCPQYDRLIFSRCASIAQTQPSHTFSHHRKADGHFYTLKAHRPEIRNMSQTILKLPFSEHRYHMRECGLKV